MGFFRTLTLSLAIVVAGYYIGNLQKIGKEYDRSVQVKGLSEREVPADLAVWPLNITLPGNDLQQLMLEMEDQIVKVNEFFIQQGFENNEITIGSTNIRDAKANIYGGNQSNRDYRYLANSEITIRTKNIEKLKLALKKSNELIANGILIGSKNSWQPIQYIFTKLNEIKPSMIEEATKNARKVAEKFARDSDSKVGKIKKARQGLFTISNRDMNTPEIKKVRVVSTIDFLLED